MYRGDGNAPIPLIWSKPVSRELTAIGVSLAVGTALFFILPSALSTYVGETSKWYVPALVLPYSVSAFGPAIIWPRLGWRLGLAVFAVWGPVIQFVMFLTADVPMRDWRGEFLDLIQYLSIAPAACLGAWLGSLVGRLVRLNSNS